MTALPTMLAWFTAGSLLVLMLRKPVRRSFGADPAFVLWSLPLLFAALPWLPAAGWIDALPCLTLPTLHVVPDHAAVGATTGHAGNPWPTWLATAWLAIAALLLADMLWQVLRLRREWRTPDRALLHTLREAGMPRHLRRRVRIHAAGPAVVWQGRHQLLLPEDFARHHDASHREMVLRHECAHLRRGDAVWCLLAGLVARLMWFHPLVWFALPRFRLDQELACDDTVLRDAPACRAAYARALFHDAVAAHATPALVSWLDEPQLKERLNMIHARPQGTLRRRFGYLASITLLACGALVAQAGALPTDPQALSTSAAAAQDASVKERVSRVAYPVDAIKSGAQGTVTLRILVAADGTPENVVVKQSSGHRELDLAAIEAAGRWRYNPGTDGDGHAQEGWAEVPIRFTLNEIHTFDQP